MSTENENNHEDPNNADASGKTGGGDSGEKTFTQAELEATLKERLIREREKYSDYDDLKKKASKFDEIEEANKTELEKAQEAARLAAEEKDKALAKANERMIRADFVAAASRLGVKHPEDAFALADRSGVLISDDGKVDGVEDAVKKLVEAGRLPLTSGPAPNMNNGAGDNDGDNTKKIEATDDEKYFAAKTGVPLEDYMKNVKAKA